MRSFFVLAVAGVAVALSATATQAATLNFTGNITAATGTSNPFLAPGGFSLFVSLPAAVGSGGGGTSSSATASTLSLQLTGGGNLLYSKGAPAVTLTFGKDGSGNDTLNILGDYFSTGNPRANLDLTFTRAATSGAILVMNEDNLATMLSNPTTYLGQFRQEDGLGGYLNTTTLGGTIPVPEPGSISLLAGLGLVCGRRVWRRRQQKQAAAV